LSMTAIPRVGWHSFSAASGGRSDFGHSLNRLFLTRHMAGFFIQPRLYSFESCPC
jgi:hypothetical protein